MGHIVKGDGVRGIGGTGMVQYMHDGAWSAECGLMG